ncbi:MAG TPA: 5-formyltetrahydrofolate cyclo-ligase [Steroidobacteraceae bacterium]|nr:5-formyltetrahydrofolate cyclo-ligase [Steroidobacteraceae bacterium]
MSGSVTASDTTLAVERSRLRAQMRAQRRALEPHERASASRQFARIMRRSQLLRPGRRIAVYIAHDHEADLSMVVRLARRNRCQLYLPAISDYRGNRMAFRRYSSDNELRPNRFRIAEPPRSAPRIAARHLDLILVPLVAVDARGTRLGSGAGFYDRHLHHLRSGRRWRRPKLIGVAYEFQRVAHLAAGPWDVPLDALVTEKELHPLRGSP